ncbi:hypothetical protein ATANTOWER_012306 [Ataeniobius toweri]|uniref:Secreted protein n=1 Tax=Ataeniobius toweri TaxID=208326 RepID=A0ABU7ATI7_9TELE|nr:hypothetical protein [Ataeniobius toweri]
MPVSFIAFTCDMPHISLLSCLLLAGENCLFMEKTKIVRVLRCLPCHASPVHVCVFLPCLHFHAKICYLLSAVSIYQFFFSLTELGPLLKPHPMTCSQKFKKSGKSPLSVLHRAIK